MFASLDLTPALLAGVTGVFGLLVGSFLNVVILRLPARLMYEWRTQGREALELEATAPEAAPPDLVFSRSHCPQCGTQLSALENIPLLSFLALRGRCRHCGKRISWQYPLVEAATGLLFAACALKFGPGLPLLAALAMTGLLVAASVIDMRTQLLPDQLTLPLLWLGLVCAVPALFVDAPTAILGAAAGYLVLWSVYWLFKLLTGKEGMGYGDFKLLAALGAFVGYQGIVPILLLASVVGAIIGTVQLAIQGKDRATPIPFGPYLAVAGWLQFMIGGRIMESYLRFMGG